MWIEFKMGGLTLKRQSIRNPSTEIDFGIHDWHSPLFHCMVNFHSGDIVTQLTKQLFWYYLTIILHQKLWYIEIVTLLKTHYVKTKFIFWIQRMQFPLSSGEFYTRLLFLCSRFREESCLFQIKPKLTHRHLNRLHVSQNSKYIWTPTFKYAQCHFPGNTISYLSVFCTTIMN